MQIELKHWGIQGQKWGVRKGPPYPLTESRKTYAEKKAAKESKPNYTVSKKYVKKHQSEMTDAELQKALNRINMQEQVNKLGSRTISIGNSKTIKILKDVTAGMTAIVGFYEAANKIRKALEK